MLALNYNMDCREGLQMLDKQSIDLTITSPPYDNLRNYKDSLEWNFDIFKSVATGLYEVTKQGGVVVWVVGDATINGSETGTSFKQALYFKEIGFNLHDTMIYMKKNPMPVKSNRYLPCFEFMFVLSKNKPKTTNLIREKSTANGKITYSGTTQEKGKFGGYGKVRNLERDKYNVWEYNVGCNQSSCDKIAFKHPAIFPEQLAEDHIISWSNEGDTVLDIFSGSGTTAKKCIETNRNFIGFEKVKAYCDISTERINKAMELNTLYELL